MRGLSLAAGIALSCTRFTNIPMPLGLALRNYYIPCPLSAISFYETSERAPQERTLSVDIGCIDEMELMVMKIPGQQV